MAVPAAAVYELYVYFKLPAPAASAALHARLQAWQQARCAECTGLEARLLERPLTDGQRENDPAVQRTWMEVYRLPASTSPGDETARRLGAGPAWLAEAGASARHVEWFCEIERPPTG